jgi:hypothetical protein
MRFGFERPESLIKTERKCEHFNWKWSREVGVEGNIYN